MKILGCGSPILDILVNVENNFLEKINAAKGGMELVSSDELARLMGEAGTNRHLAPGGSSANTILGLQKLGVATAFLGKLGMDQEGDFYFERYKALGGDTKSLKKDSDIPSAKCLSLITPDSERTMRTDLGAAATLTPDEINDSDFENISYVHVEGYLIFNKDLLFKILKLAKKNNCKVSLDLASFEIVNSAKDILPDMLDQYIDIVFSNEDEAEAFCSKNPKDALIELSKYCETSVVKIGAKGSLVNHKGKNYQNNAIMVNSIDTTGAGDLWQAGFLYGLMKGYTPDKAAYIGSLLGSEVVKVIGAVIPDERWNFIKDKISKL